MRLFAVVALVVAITLGGCGYRAVDSEMTGQAKKVMQVTPLLCPDRVDFDMSMGVMKGGSGSVSSEDIVLTVGPGVDIRALKQATKDTSIVNVHYDTRRFFICTQEHILTGFEVEK